jgi:hypothetical protein
VETYPCPHCGGTTIADGRCQSCERPYDPELAKLAMFQRWVAALEAKKRKLTGDQLVLRGQLAHASAQRDSLARQIRQRGEGPPTTPPTTRGGGPRTLLPRPGRRAAKAEPTTQQPPVRQPGALTGRRVPQMRKATVLRTPLPPPGARPAAGDGPPAGEGAVAGEGAAAGEFPAAATPAPTRLPPVRGLSRLAGAETTTRTTQTVLLALGGMLLGGAAIVVAVVAFGAVSSVGRVALLMLITAIALVAPVRLARQTLTATAETVAAVALLMVLLNGYMAWTLGLFGAGVLPDSFYFGLVCAVTAIIAAAYRTVTHLIAPRFATILALQPVLPLLAYHWINGPAGWALVLTGVAAVDLAICAGLAPGVNTRPMIDIPPAPAESAEPAEPVEDEGPPPPAWTRAPALLHEMSWLLFAVAFGAAVAYGAAALGSTTTLAATLRAAVVALLTAAVGLGGGLTLRRGPLPDLAAGLATVTVITTITRVGSVALPGHLPIFAAGAVALAGLAVRALPAASRRGPQIATGISALAVAVLLAIRGAPAIWAPLSAVRPIWQADLDRYPRILADAAGPAGWQLFVAGALLTFAAALALPAWVRIDAVLVGSVFTMMTAPAALHMSSTLTPTVLVAGAIAFGGLAMMARLAPAARGCVVAAAVLGCYAAAASLTSADTTALTLTAITFAGAIIASPRPARPDPYAEVVAQRVADAAAGGAAFAFPGAVATGMAALIGEQVIDTGAPVILAAAFLAEAASLAFVAVTLVARRRGSPPLLTGATAGAVAVAIAAILAPHTTVIDVLLGLLLLAGAIAMWMAPRLDQRRLFGQPASGPDIAAAVVTAGVIAALARAASHLVPGLGLVTVALLVLLLAVSVRAMPEQWRRGPVAGGVLIGAVVAATTGAAAVGGAIGVIRAADPIWHADLGAAWLRTARQFAEFGWQPPVALVVLALAAMIGLPEPLRDDAAVPVLGLALLAAPTGLSLAWWSPIVLGVIGSMALGAAAALARTPRTAYVRGAVAMVLAFDAAGASIVRADVTAATLASLALVGAFVAALAAVTRADRAADGPLNTAHLVTVGGGAILIALIALPGAAAAVAGGQRYHTDIILSAALAATALGLAVAGLVCQREPGLLAYTTAGVGASSIVITLASIPTTASTGLYAAAAALLGVLAELLRLDARIRLGWQPADGMAPVRGFRPDRAWMPIRRWRPARRTTGFGTGIALASGIPAAIAVIVVGPAVVAALIGPYQWVTRIWQGTPETASSLGQFDRWTGTGTDVIAAAALTLAAALAAVGLGGRGGLAASRTVATVIPGLGLTMLIAPDALHAPYPAAATAALLVATLAGLGLALTEPAPEGDASLRNARRLVFLLAAVSAGAGGAGSLATKSQTITWLAGSVVVGLIGALGGRYGMARMIGWHVAAGTAVALALAASLAAGLPATVAAFPVLAVAGLLLAFAALLPKVHPTETTSREVFMIEAAGYNGAAAAVGLTVGSLRHTAAVCVALGAVLGLAAAMPGRGDAYRRALIIAGALSELAAIWILLRIGQVTMLEAYTLPFAAVALLVGLLEIRIHPELGSWLAYGPALITAFLPTLVVVLISDASPTRRVLLIVGGVLTLAVGSLRRQKAPVQIGSVVTVVATVHELFLLGRLLPGWVLLVLFSAAGLLLVGLGATYEKRRHDVQRLRGALGRMR